MKLFKFLTMMMLICFEIEAMRLPRPNNYSSTENDEGERKKYYINPQDYKLPSTSTNTLMVLNAARKTNSLLFAIMTCGASSSRFHSSIVTPNTGNNWSIKANSIDELPRKILEEAVDGRWHHGDFFEFDLLYMAKNRKDDGPVCKSIYEEMLRQNKDEKEKKEAADKARREEREAYIKAVHEEKDRKARDEALRELEQ